MDKYYCRKPRANATFAIMVFFLFFGLSSYAQTIQKVGKQYHHNLNVYDKKEIKIVFSESEQSMVYYNQAMSKSRRSSKTAKAALITFSLGSLILFTASNDQDFGQSLIMGSLGILLNTSAIVLGIVSLRSVSKHRTYMKNAVNHYNWEVESRTSPDIGDVQIGITSNGFGLVYTF